MCKKILPNLNFQQNLGTLCQWMGLIRFTKGEDEDLWKSVWERIYFETVNFYLALFERKTTNLFQKGKFI